MNSLWNPEHRVQILRRLNALQPESVPKWGKMNCKQMLAHLSDSMRMALGELEITPKSGPLRLRPLRYAIIYWFPFPKGAPTAPELIARQSDGWQQEADDLKALIARLSARVGQPVWPEHPLFGDLSEQDWGALCYKHIDHHLRQFNL